MKIRQLTRRKSRLKNLVLSEGHISGKIAFSSTRSALWYDRGCLTNLNLTNQQRRLGSSVAGKISKQSWLESSKGFLRSSPGQPPPPSFVCIIVDWSPKQTLAGDFSYFRLINHIPQHHRFVYSVLLFYLDWIVYEEVSPLSVSDSDICSDCMAYLYLRLLPAKATYNLSYFIVVEAYN